MKKFSFALAVLIIIWITACSESDIEEALGIDETYSLCIFSGSLAVCTSSDCDGDNRESIEVYSSYDTCENAANTWNSGSSNASGSGSSCTGDTTPYGDVQLDVQCQAACSYLEVNNEAGVTGSCNILTSYEGVLDDVRASDCPACSSR